MYFNEKYFLLSIIMLIASMAGAYSVYARNDIRVIQSDENKLLFEYKPAPLSVIASKAGDENDVDVMVENCGLIYEQGKPVLPYRKILVGVPDKGQYRVKILSYQYNDLTGYRVGPAPKIAGNPLTRPNDEKYFIDEDIYSRDGFFPTGPIEVSQPSWLRHQRVIDVQLFPVLYNPVTNVLRVCTGLTVQVDFSVPPASLKKADTRADAAFANLYADVVLNYETARKWKRSQPVNLHRKAVSNKGAWYKLVVEKDGMYKFDYDDFVSLHYDSTLLDPDQIQIFYGGGRELPREVNATVPELRQVAVYFYDDNKDGRLGRHDYILFYGQATSGWLYANESYSHYINHYTDANVYWLAIGNGTRKEMKLKEQEQPDALPVVADKYRARIFMEQELLNDEKSGIQWMWSRLSGTTLRQYPINLHNVCPDDSFEIRIRVQGVTENRHDILFYLNDQFLQQISLPYTLAGTARIKSAGVIHDGENTLKIELQNKGNDKNEIYFDWYEMEYWRSLVAVNNQLFFSSSGRQGPVEYRLAGFDQNEQVTVFDITDVFDVAKLEDIVRADSTTIIFQDRAAAEFDRQYVALTADQYKKVQSCYPAENPYSDLRATLNSADYVIITHKKFDNQDLQRLADHRRNGNGWTYPHNPAVKIVTTEQIYDQFAWGLFDPTAIRNFLQYAYENWQVAPSYVLLVGDAYYNMKGHNQAIYTTYVPTYEDELRATDDWFVCLDGDRKMDMLIGRLPVQNEDELKTAVDKIIDYDTSIPFGPWRNTILLIADNSYAQRYVPEDYVFTRDTEELARDPATKSFDIRKIYLRQFSRNRFGKMPRVKARLISEINKGVLYFNFLGHGNLEVLTHEDIFYSPDDVYQLNNGRFLPLFFFGTCAAGQFDYDRKKSLAEELLLYPDGGGFAIIAGTRWNAHQFTYDINRNFYSIIFSAGKSKSIGQALTEAKLLSRYPDHRELLTLFGDPAQRLAAPEYDIRLSVLPDSLQLTRRVRLTGAIYEDGKIADDFSGSLTVKIYDSYLKRTLPDYSSYLLPGRVLYRNVFEVERGKVATDFFLRADTIAGGDLGRVVAYAWQKNEAGEFLDASGALDSLYIAADTLTADTRIDTIGPEIDCEINGIAVDVEDENDIYVDPSFEVVFNVTDDFSGIYANPGGDYEMTIRLDGMQESTWDVTSDFEFDAGTNRSGRVLFRFHDLPAGDHQLVFSVWDNALNPSAKQIRFVVSPDFRIIDPLNYPNPASRQTSFTFTLTHDAEVTIKIYTVAGRLIRTLQAAGERGFNRIPENGWNCTDQDGDVLANGVYLYKIIANRNRSLFEKNETGLKAENIGRMILIN